MEEKKVIKISLKTVVILILTGILVLAGILYFIKIRESTSLEVEHYKASYNFKANRLTTEEAALLKGETWKIINSYEEYQQFCQEIQEYIMDDIVSDFSYEYDMYKQNLEQQKVSEKSRKEKLDEKKEEIKKRYETTYQEDYSRQYSRWYEEIPEEKFNEEFFKVNSLLIVNDYSINAVLHTSDLKKFSIVGNTAIVSMNRESGGYVGGGNGIINYIVLDNKNVNNVELKIEQKDTSCDEVYKPIVYLYPTEETNVNVTVGNPQNLTHTYPKYNNGWNVKAKPNGDLIDINTGRSLYALYWEGLNIIKPNMEEGFIIEGKDTIAFLEEKLAILGLNEREANEFIIYWLPKLENNKYNFIRFQTMEEINRNMPLQVEPAPDTTIRVMMEFKGLNEKINVKEQMLETPQRNGFVVVEWGGTEIK